LIRLSEASGNQATSLCNIIVAWLPLKVKNNLEEYKLEHNEAAFYENFKQLISHLSPENLKHLNTFAKALHEGCTLSAVEFYEQYLVTGRKWEKEASRAGG
jgi:hypothetical protein